MIDNIFIKQDPAGNIKTEKENFTEKIDGAVATIMALDRAVATIMALDRAIRNRSDNGSIYDARGILVF